MKMKSPEKTSKLIKQIAHQLGSTLVGIAKLNPDWVYLYPMRGRGFEPDKPIDIPDHWQYAVVVGTPMSWDPMYANPNFGTSNDAYSRSRIVAFRVASFIKQLGYAARPHTPGTSYDLMVPPIAIDAGLGAFDFALTEFCESPQLARYGAESEGHFVWHSDIGDGPVARKRKLTLVVQLSAPEAYEGGALEIMPDANILVANRMKGAATVFPSFVLHRVTPVTRGNRHSLTVWAHGPAFR